MRQQFALVLSFVLAAGCGNDSRLDEPDDDGADADGEMDDHVHDHDHHDEPDASNVDQPQTCNSHFDCASSTCLDEGVCANASDVAYVSGLGTGTECTQAAPCPTLGAAIATNLAYVKLATGAAIDTTGTLIEGHAVSIFGDPGAALGRSTEGAILTVGTGSAVIVRDVTFENATGNDAAVKVSAGTGSPTLELHNVTVRNNAATGVKASGGALVITRSTIEGNGSYGLEVNDAALTVSRSLIAANEGGGINLYNDEEAFSITSSFLVRNQELGGAVLQFRAGTVNTFAFNTVVDNRGRYNTGGVTCFYFAPQGSADYPMPNNLVLRNALGTPSNTNQTFGTCDWNGSLRQGDLAGVGLARPEGPAPLFDYHLTPGSIAIDAGTTVNMPVADFDGDPRALGGAADLGADELQ